MRMTLIALLISLAAPLTAMAETDSETANSGIASAPSVKIVNFTADWCPNCVILNPRLDEVISRFDPGQIKRVDLDMTSASRRSPEALRIRTFSRAVETADAHQASYLWDWYGGVTGIAVFISADNGEPLTCVNRGLSVDQMEARMKQAILLAEHGKPGERKPDGPDCPAPLR